MLSIETRGLGKRYRGGTIGLHPLDLKVPAGVCFGLLGPNGAGKSTLVKSLLTIIRATSGEALLLGRDHRDPEARRGVGYLAEGHAFPEVLTGREVCRYMGRLGGLWGGELEARIDKTVQRVGMAARCDERVADYSKGMKQRIGIAQALLGDPQLVFLDEPTDGVDPVGRKEIREIVRGLVDDGKTVFVNSHQLAELETMCDEVAVLHHGRLLTQGKLADVKASIAKRRGTLVTFRVTPCPLDLVRRLGGEVDDTVPHVSTFELPIAADAIDAVVDALRAEGIGIRAIQPRAVSLEDAFVAIVEEAGS